MKPPPCPVCYLINCDCDRRKKEFIQERIADALERIALALERKYPPMVLYASGNYAPSEKQNCMNHYSPTTDGFCNNCGESVL